MSGFGGAKRFFRNLNQVFGKDCELLVISKDGRPVSDVAKRVVQSLQRGEIQGRIGWSWGSVKSRSADWIKDDKIRILILHSF